MPTKTKNSKQFINTEGLTIQLIAITPTESCVKSLEKRAKPQRTVLLENQSPPKIDIYISLHTLPKE